MMKLQSAVKRETLRIALGTVCLACVMMLVFLLLGQFDLSVLSGALLGCVTAVGNFFLMALTIQRAVESLPQGEQGAAPAEPSDGEAADGEAADEESGADRPPALSREARQRIQLSYTLRMLMIGAVGVLALTVDFFHPVATLLCLLFPRVVIFALGRIDQKQEGTRIG